MKKIIYFAALLLLSTQALMAQSEAQATAMIDEFIKMAKTNPIKADFKLSVYDSNDHVAQSQKGTFYLKKDRFRLKMDEIDIIFDGKTQWSYSASSNEVSITEPIEEELVQINPIAVISDYKDNSIIIFSRHEKSPQEDIIVMIPTIPGADFESIDVYINKQTKNLSALKMTSTSDYNIKIDFTNFQKGAVISDKTFVFDKKDYPDVYVNDMR